LRFLEKIITVYKSFKISLIQITQISGNLNETSWKKIKVIGTYISNIIIVGTFYSNSGMEFWLLTKGDNPIIIELENYKYKRMMIGIRDKNEWIHNLNKMKEKINKK